MRKIGFIVPVITVFDESGAIDEAGNRRIIERLVSAGVDGIAIMGSTGEFFGLTKAQKKQLIVLASRQIAGRTRLLVGIGTADSREAAELADFAAEHGAEGAMVIATCYFPISDDNIISFYGDVAENTSANIIIYNFPARTGYDVKPHVVAELARRHKNIIGIKDSVADPTHTREIIKAVRADFPEFEVYNGMDDNFMHTVLSGGNGSIGALGNLVPELVSSLSKKVRAGDFASAACEQAIIDRLVSLYDITTPFVPALKAAVRMRGLDISGKCLPPFLGPNKTQIEQIRALLDSVGI